MDVPAKNKKFPVRSRRFPVLEFPQNDFQFMAMFIINMTSIVIRPVNIGSENFGDSLVKKDKW